MVKKNIIERKKDHYISKTIKLTDPKSIATVSSDLAWDILNTISERPLYPNEIAKRLEMNEQKIYYHVRRMEEAGIIKVAYTEDRHGATCKYYAPTSQAFGFELPVDGTKVKSSSQPGNPELMEFFNEFTDNGIFNGSVVVGSPVSHGPYLTAARDGHHAVQLSMFLGSMISLEDRFIVKLDTEVKSESAEDRNMILIGGPVTNMIANDLNENLKMKFNWDNNWSIESKESGKNYNNEMDALIAKVKNPWDENKSIIILCGLKNEGTKTAILALTQRHEDLLKNYNKDKDFYALVRGLDKDGDGKVDDIRILETIP